MLSKLKEKVQSLLSTEARIALKMGLSPNAISIIGLIFSIFSGAAYFFSLNQTWFLFVAAALLLISGFCDVLDGVLARTYDQETIFGGFFDSLLDRHSESVVYIGIIAGGLCSPFWGMLALVGALLVSYSRAKAEAVGIKMMSIGLMERAERILLLIGSSIIAFFWLPALNIGIISLAILSNFTVIQRALYVYVSLKKK
jgi:archaetidylinositol phosphate synthase